MADLQSERLDVNTGLVEAADGSVAQSMIATKYLEDFLFNVLEDLNAINDEVVAGAVNDGANLGAGAKVFAQKDGTNLEFRTLTSDDGSVTITEDTEEIDFSVNLNVDDGTVANSLTTWDGVSQWTELPQVLLSWTSGVATLSVLDDGAVYQTGITIDADGQLGMFHDGAEVANTRAAAAGGLFVNNTLTGGGFERVLTTSDVAATPGGVLPAPTVDNSLLTSNLGGSNWTELSQSTMSWSAGVLTWQVEDGSGVLQNGIVIDADGAADINFDGSTKISSRAFGAAIIGNGSTFSGFSFQLVSGTQDAQVGYDGTNNRADFAAWKVGEDLVLRTTNVVSGDTLHLRAVGGGSRQTEAYFGNALAMETATQGIRVIDASGADDPFVRFYNSANTTELGVIGLFNGTYFVNNETVSGIMRLKGQDSGNVDTTMLELDPDGAVQAFFDGASFAGWATTLQGVRVQHSTNAGTALVEIAAGVGQNSSINFVENVSTDMQIQYQPGANEGYIRLTDSGDQFRLFNLADGDMAIFQGGGAQQFFHAGGSTPALATQAQGITVRHPNNNNNTIIFVDSTTGFNPSIIFQEALTNRALIQYLGGDNLMRFRTVVAGEGFLFRNDVHGDSVKIEDDGIINMNRQSATACGLVFQDSEGGTVRANINYNNTNNALQLFTRQIQEDITLRTEEYGGGAGGAALNGVVVNAETASAGTNVQLFSSDGSGNVFRAIQSAGHGANIYDAVSTGTVPEIRLFSQANAEQGRILVGTSNFDVRGSVNAQNMRLRATNAAATLLTGFEYDPDLGSNGGVGFNTVAPSAPQTYTITNVTTDRAYDANATSVAELADVLGTLIDDLRNIGLTV